MQQLQNTGYLQINKQRVSTPSFLIKTYEILEDPQYNDIISWISDGSAFVIKNINDLIREVLPNHFKHNNYASFVRQLNKYDFHKIRNQSGENQFCHQFFQKGNKTILKEIRRKQNEQTSHIEEISNKIGKQTNKSGDFYMKKLKNEQQFFFNEMQDIKDKQLEIQQTMRTIIKQNDKLIDENRLRLNEIKNIREFEENKIETLSFLLATIITNRGQNTYPLENKIYEQKDDRSQNLLEEREKQNLSSIEGLLMKKNQLGQYNQGQQNLGQLYQNNSNIVPTSQYYIQCKIRINMKTMEQISQANEQYQQFGLPQEFFCQQDNMNFLENQFDQKIASNFLLKQMEMIEQLKQQQYQQQYQQSQNPANQLLLEQNIQQFINYVNEQNQNQNLSKQVENNLVDNIVI